MLTRVRGRRDGRSSGFASATEVLLAQRWSSLLGEIEVRSSDTFYGLGGSSLQVVDMLEAIRHDWSMSLSPADIAEYPTLREFAAHIDDLRTTAFRTRVSTTVCLRKGSGAETLPLFCFAGAGATSLSFVRIAGELDPGTPVYSLQARGLESRAMPDWSIRRAARRQVREIRRIQQVGPYHLTGHSSGGIIALECARILVSQGERVAPIVLLDSAVPPNILRTQQDAPVEQRSGKVGISVDVAPLRERLLMHARVLVCGWVQFDIHTQQVVMWEHGRRAHNRHRLERFDHPVAVAVTEENVEQHRWWPLVTGAATRTVPIGELHNDVVRDPVAVMQCADLISEWTYGAG